jgi:hypothetical protein
MKPGPIIIIPCPICRYPGKKTTLMSGNTIGSVLWSDGKRISPMLPEYPWLVKCRKFGKFFYAEDSDAIHSINWSDEDK